MHDFDRDGVKSHRPEEDLKPISRCSGFNGGTWHRLGREHEVVEKLLEGQALSKHSEGQLWQQGNWFGYSSAFWVAVIQFLEFFSMYFSSANIWDMTL